MKVKYNQYNATLPTPEAGTPHDEDVVGGAIVVFRDGVELPNINTEDGATIYEDLRLKQGTRAKVGFGYRDSSGNLSDVLYLEEFDVLDKTAPAGPTGGFGLALTGEIEVDEPAPDEPTPVE